jgi:P-type E1-E2 ATPase
MNYEIPGKGKIEINTIVLDLNGTLSVKGKIVEGVKERLNKLKNRGFRIIFFSGDTRGNAKDIAKNLEIDFIKASSSLEKEAQIKKLKPETCAAIGNGLIDLRKIKLAKIGIVTLQSEGVHIKTLTKADIVVPSINDALDLFIDENSLIATLRK